MSAVASLLLVLRTAKGLTQEEVAEEAGMTQATLSRYEQGLREPDSRAIDTLSRVYGVTVDFLTYGFHLKGGLAADAHMRRFKTAKPTDWKRVEARLNLLRMQSSFLFDRLPLEPENHVASADPDRMTPSEAAQLVRSAWRVPIGPIRTLIRWVESAGVIVICEDFGTRRIDAMSQWAGDHAVIVLNSILPTDRKRWTIAHELGHLVLHSNYVDLDVNMERQADEFAGEFLTPAHLIKPELRNLTLAKLAALKLEWGTSMQSLIERAYGLDRISNAERTSLYKQLSARGWRTNEPYSDSLMMEEPKLASTIGERLVEAGASLADLAKMTGVRSANDTVFAPTQTRSLRIIR